MKPSARMRRKPVSAAAVPLVRPADRQRPNAMPENRRRRTAFRAKIVPPT
jgi:hypothetical protein